MTHRYGHENTGKMGTSWLLFHCALCGDLLQRYDVSVRPNERVAHGLCGCTADLQRARRRVREREHEHERERAQREREHGNPLARPDRSDQVTKLGA